MYLEALDQNGMTTTPPGTLLPWLPRLVLDSTKRRICFRIDWPYYLYG